MKVKDIISGEYENIFICSDDLNIENKLYEKYSKKYKCFVYIRLIMKLINFIFSYIKFP